ncbi:MAG: hypothetical protein H6584_06530 [Flavobacteriales bacterium]|nr:hypothetical protein [Flavobacteriales bacterium]
MYYYYYYHGKDTVKVNVRLTFKDLYDDKLTLEAMESLIGNINEIHKVILIMSQSEYIKNKGRLTPIAKMLSYNMLEVDSMWKKGVYYILEISFELFVKDSNIYWTIWKVLIDICKRYGRTARELNTSLTQIIEEAKTYILQIFPEIDFSSRDNIEALIKNMLMDKRFMEFYNSFCETSIVITDFLVDIDFTKIIDVENTVKFSLISNTD